MRATGYVLFVLCTCLLPVTASAAVTPISLTGPVSDWDIVLKGTKFDPGNDQQASSNPGVDIVGTDFDATLFIIYDDKGTALDDTDDEVAFRVRLGGANSQGGFGGYLWVGLDVDLDGDLDAFLNVYGDGKTGVNFAGSVSVYAAGSDLNTSPSTSSGTDPTLVTTLTDYTVGGAFAFLPVDGTTDPFASDTDINDDTKTDRLLSFKVLWSALVAEINKKPITGGGGALIGSLNGGTGISKTSPLQFSLSTSTNSNNVNSDVGGYDNKNDDMSVSYADQGAFSSPLSFSNIFPVINSNGGGADASVDVDENTTTVTTVSASDANGDTISYSISGGSESGAFTINASTGELAFSAAPDFEAPTDTAPTNSYVVTVQASDGKGGTDTQTLTVNVQDVAEGVPDVTAPVITSIVRQSPLAALTNADSLVFRVTFDEAVQNIDTGDFTVGGTAGVGSVLSITAVSSAAYDVTLDNVATGEGTVSLGIVVSHDITDTSGNALTVLTPTDANESFTLDNTVPTVAIQDVPAATRLPFTATVEFSESVTGFGVADISATNASLSDFAMVDADTYTVTVTPLLETAFTLDVTAGVAVDGAGNGNPAAPQAAGVYDITGPAATVSGFSVDTGTSGDNITSDNTLVLSGTTEAGASVVVLVDGVSAGNATAEADGSWSFDYSSVVLTEDTYSFTAVASDTLGNVGNASSALAITIDTTAPAAPAITGLSDDTGTSSDGITADTTLVFSGTAVADSEVEVFLGGTSIGVTTSNGSGAWSFDYSATTLSPGDYSLTATVRDVAGNESADSGAFAFSVDTSAPGAPAVTGISDDTNLGNDQVTSDNTLVFSGTAAAGATVEVFLDGVSLGTTAADGFGAWSYDHSAALLADDTYAVTASAQDAAGNTSPLSPALAVTIDTAAPAAPAVATISGDTNVDGDAVTSDTTLVFSGTAPASTIVEVLLDGASLGTTTSSAAGAWSFDHSGTSLSAGTYSLTARTQDLAGNTSAASAALAITIDTTEPAAPAVTGISEDTGVAGDLVTSDTTLIFTGSAEANASVEIFLGPTSLGSTTASAVGVWSFDHTGSVLAPDTYAVSARATDLAGNTSAQGSAATVVVDTSAPATPAITVISNDTNVGDDGVTSDTTLVISGTAAFGTRVEILIDGVSVGSALTDLLGGWSFDYSGTTLPDDSYDLTASAADLAGNSSPLSPVFAVIVDTVAPATPVLTQDGQTLADSTPVLSGSAEPDAAIRVTLSGGEILTTQADGSGNWSVTVTSPLPQGSVGVTVSATDLAGNVSTVLSTSFTIDIPVDAANSSVTATPASLPADGVSTSVLEVDVRDAGNSPISGVVVTIVTTHGSVGPVSEIGGGIYRATLTAPLLSGIAEVSASSDTDLIGTVSVVLTAADGDNDGIPNDAEDTDGDGDPSNDDLDGDGTPNYLDDDDDGDGRTTDEEDVNGNGDPFDDDTDGDSIPDFLDPDDSVGGDSDNDGITDIVECASGWPCVDSDGDGLPDYNDTDDDNDGVPTAVEGEQRDTDDDGVPDYLDNDDDGDGLLTVDEDADIDGDGNPASNPGPDQDGDGIPAYLDPNDGDTSGPGDADGDGLSDDQECLSGPPCSDSDNDGAPDFNDADDDNDGVDTGAEDSNNDGDATNDDTDGDGIADYLDSDDDGDGTPTVSEGSGDADADGIPDYLDADSSNNAGALDGSGDSDGDGLSDSSECPAGVPCTDSDGDGIPDYMDADDDNDGIDTVDEDVDNDGDPANDDSDADGTPDYLDSDDDNDGVPTGTDGTGDSDGDGIPDYLDPGAADSDGDGLGDGIECLSGIPCTDSDGDGLPDFIDPDDDSDGIDTVDEDLNGDGDPRNEDSDGDGIADYLDADDDQDGIDSILEGSGDSDSDGIPDYLDVDSSGALDGSGDSDGDGLSDASECAGGIPCADTDGNGVPDYLDPDDDGDGVLTRDEDVNGNGAVTDDNTDGDGLPNYLDPDDDGDGTATLNEGTGDSDGDGIPDHLDPATTDSDGDGVPDARECDTGLPCRDSDADGIADYLDTDDDNDGVLTINENPNQKQGAADDDTDGDGAVNYLDADDDNDGLLSSVEGTGDADADGIVDYLDVDSTNVAATADGSGDSDADGRSDAQECPSLPCRDSNNDGVPDYMQFGTQAHPAPRGKVTTSVSGAGSAGTFLLGVVVLFGLARRRLPLAAFIGVMTATVQAEPARYYGGIGVGQSWLEPSTAGSGFRVTDETDRGWHLLGGWRWRKDIAFEGFHGDIGAAGLAERITGARADIDYRVTAALANWYPLQDTLAGNARWNWYVQGGLSTISNSSSVPHDNDHSAQLALGAGVDFRLVGPWVARGAVQAFDRDASYVSVSLVRRFGASVRAAAAQEVTPQPTAVPPAQQEPVIAAPPPDADKDGVEDQQDRCTDTPPGVAVNETGCSALDQTLEGLVFASGSAAIQPESFAVLDRVHAALVQFPEARIELAAHTDAQGNEGFNQRLSEQRAAAVKRYLVERGIEPERIESHGYGESRPVGDNATPEGRARNRRVEMKLLGG